MNKYQEALDNLSNEVFSMFPTYDLEGLADDTRTLQELVDRSIPKKPVRETETGLSYEACPKCGSLAMDDSDYGTAHDYCPNCGQALDRSEHWSIKARNAT